MNGMSEEDLRKLEVALDAARGCLPAEYRDALQDKMHATFSAQRISNKIAGLIIRDRSEDVVEDALEWAKEYKALAEYFRLVEAGLDSFIAALQRMETSE